MPGFDRAAVMRRVWSHVERRSPDECWPWKRRTLRRYPCISVKIDGRWRSRDVHRLILEEKLGRELRPGEQALHRCDHGWCCNPACLRPGTHDENMRDKSNSGAVLGERNPNSKLSDEQRRAILADRRSHSAVARELGVTKQCVSMIRRGVRWKR